MLTINSLPEAEKFVARQQRLGSDVRWDGWDMVFFRETPDGARNPNGVIRNGRYGFDNRSVVTEAGTWEIDFRNVRRAPKSSRN